MPLKKPPQKIASQPIVKTTVKEPTTKESSPTPAWGGSTAQTTKLSLLDLMNEEMSKQVINKTPPIQIQKSQKQQHQQQKQSKESTTPNTSKGWNVPTQSSTTPNTIAQIIEMEKRSKEQYVKLKNIPLNLIQMEEAAIEELKKYYQVDNLTDMNIKIEIVDSENINCAPVWRH